MTPIEERFTAPRLDGLHLHILRWGAEQRPRLVLLHGGGANAHWWDHIAPALADRFHVIALDFRGHGDSDYPESCEIGAFAYDVAALIDHIGGDDPIAFVGHSMGANVGFDHVADNPRALALVMIDPARGAGRRARRSARLALALRRSYATREEAIDRYRFMPAAEHAPESRRVAIARHSVMREPDGRYSFKFDPRWFGIGPSTRPDPASVRCPTLVVRGAESALLAREAAEDLVARLPRGRLAEIEGAGHHVLLDRPEELIDTIRGFLDTLPVPGM